MVSLVAYPGTRVMITPIRVPDEVSNDPGVTRRIMTCYPGGRAAPYTAAQRGQ